MSLTHQSERDLGAESTHEYVSLYVIEEVTGEILDAVYEADDLVVPVVGDRVSFVEASLEGNLDENVRYRETQDDSSTYVVERRDVTYLHVDYDLDDAEHGNGLVTEVRLWVRDPSEE